MLLVTCSGCQRHVKSGEAACPFCGASLADVSVRAVPPMPELSRAAAVFIGAAALVGCGKEPAPAPPPAPVTTDMPAPAYGPPPVAPTPELLIEPPPVMDAGVVPVARPDAGPPKK